MNDVEIEIEGSFIPLNAIRTDKGVIIPYSQSDQEEIYHHFEGFRKFRETSGQLIKNPEVIRNLPFSITTRTWKNKTNSLKLIRKITNQFFSKTHLNVLIVGSGNGWLANQLAGDGHQVLGTDILYYEFDGLQTIKHFERKFSHLLLHPHEINRIKGKFDLIVFENNLPYVKGVFQTVESAKGLLNDNGILLCTGINVSYNEEEEKRRISNLEKEFLNRWKHKINTYQTKMYFSEKDLKDLKNLGFEIGRRVELRNYLNALLRRKVVIFDATFQF